MSERPVSARVHRARLDERCHGAGTAAAVREHVALVSDVALLRGRR